MSPSPLSTARSWLQTCAVWFRDRPVVRRLTPARLRFWLAKRLFPPEPPAWRARLGCKRTLLRGLHSSGLCTTPLDGTRPGCGKVHGDGGAAQPWLNSPNALRFLSPQTNGVRRALVQLGRCDT